jgi:GrpB-like predicted nucleotidyltransferase (UPF0157 family)
MTCPEPLGLEPGRVRVVDYDPRWVTMFVAERQRLLEACGPLQCHIEHVGGTSIPGMCAKPVLDIAVGRPVRELPAAYVDALEQAGYECRGERGVPGRLFFRRGQPVAYHLHLVEYGGPLWRDLLAFRDHLVAYSDVAREFADAKRRLATRHASNRDAYVAAKAMYVQQVLEHIKTRRAPAMTASNR